MNTEDNERFSEWYKALHLDIKEDVCAFSAKCGFNAAETPLLERIAELEGQLANREPFVVKLPLSISVLISDGLRADFMLNSEVKAAITAAGGTVL
jgi:hypothetical protein